MTSKSNNLELTMILNSGIAFLSTSVMKRDFTKKPYERPVLVVIETDASFDKNGQVDQNDDNDQNDHPVQDNEILNDDQSEHSNPKNDNHIIDNLPNTKDV
ncbi:hypothetical protein Tco_1374047 [Tanacetum coccineum]